MDVNMESMMSKPDVPKRKRMMKSLLIMKVERSIKVEPYIFIAKQYPILHYIKPGFVVFVKKQKNQ